MMTTPRSLESFEWLAVAVASCLLAPLTEGARQVAVPSALPGSTADTLITFRGYLSSNSRPEVRRIELGPASTGWEITLDIADPEALDLDLLVYGGNPAGGSPADTLCRSEGVGRRETCRLIPQPRGPVWVAVVPVQGESRSAYVLQARTLRGPVLHGTNLVTNDAKLIPDSGAVLAAFGPSDPGVGGAVGQHLYEVRRPGIRDEVWQVSVVSADRTITLAVSAYDTSGALVAATPGSRGYEDLRVGRPGARWFVLVRLTRTGDIRRSPSYTLSLVRLGDPIPVTLSQGDFRATGTEDREFSLPLRRGQIATVVLEGWATLSVMVGDSSVPVTNSFGNVRQLAWVGAAVGSSRYLLQGASSAGLLRIRVVARPDTLRYQRLSEWGLRVLAPSSEQRYVVRFAASGAVTWLKWWADPLKSGPIPPGEVAIIELSAPPDLSSAGGESSPSQLVQGVRRAPPKAQFLARLSDAAAERFDLAVCTEDGQALDIGEAAVRWEWPDNASPVYLLVLPDPWKSDAPGGEFRLELTRSVISTAK